MCGIVGSINSQFNLSNALSKIKHRVPDADDCKSIARHVYNWFI
jgi:hypothetical protein